MPGARSVPHRFLFCTLAALPLLTGAGLARAELSDYEICREASGEVNARIAACTRILDDLADPQELRSRAARERAHAHYLKGEYERAIADYTVALQLGPATAALHIERGLAYEDKNDDERAVADYTKAIRIAPDQANAYHCRGRVHLSRLDYERAIADFTQAIRHQPGFGFSYYLRAHAQEELGQEEVAAADYRKALSAAHPYDESLVRAALRRLGAAP